MYNKIIKIVNGCFVIIFFILLIVPVLKIDMSEVSNYEYRTLAKFPSFYTKKMGLNFQWGREFDEWFSSRCNMRYKLINLYKMFSCGFNIKYCINGEKVFDKKNNVLYTESFFGIYSDAGARNEDTVKSVTAKNFQKINDFCKRKGIKFYVLVIPRRADFVKFNTPVRRFKKSHDFAEDLIDTIKNSTDVNIIYPYNEMSVANKYNAVYYKTDHHFTQYGAYISYDALMQNIKKDLPDIHIEKLNNFVIYKDKRVKTTYDGVFHSGTMLRMAGFPLCFVNKILDKDYLYFSKPNSNYIEYMQFPNEIHSKTDFYVHNPHILKRKALVIGDSFNSNLLFFLQYSFRDIAIYSISSKRPCYDDIKEIIDTFKPDVVIINIRSFLLEIFFNLFPLQNTKQGEQ